MTRIKKKRFLKGFLLGIVLTCLTFYVLINIFMYLVVLGGPGRKLSDVTRYQEIFDEKYKLQTGLIVFPEAIPQDVVEPEFRFRWRDSFDTPTHEIFLQCNYDDDEYKNEIERLEKVVKVYGKRREKLLHKKNENFLYEAYVSIENHQSTYEYAILTGFNQITYISLSKALNKTVRFPSKYLPIDYFEEDTGFAGGYSIYMESNTNLGLSSDFTRDEEVVVEDAHMQVIGDYFVIVFTELDSQGNEVITSCERGVQNAYEPAKKKVWSDINGTIYQEMLINKERTRATIIYKEDGVDKEFVIEIPN